MFFMSLYFCEIRVISPIATMFKSANINKYLSISMFDFFLK